MTRALLALSLFAAPAMAQTEVVWVNPANSTMMTIPSVLRAAAPAEDSEAADDFEVAGTIERIDVGGYQCFNCALTQVAGVFVRFYEWTPAGPGALQAEHHLAASDPGFRFDPLEPAALEVTLPAPFAASGRHFVSVQLEVGAEGAWAWWVSAWASPSLQRLWHRDRANGAWGAYRSPFGGDVVADLTFTLWGRDATPPPAGSDPCGDWVEVPSPDPAGTRHVVLRDIEVVADDDVWAVGENQVLVAGRPVTLTHTAHWDGSAWSVVPSPCPPIPAPPGATCRRSRRTAPAGSGPPARGASATATASSATRSWCCAGTAPNGR
jgi:hypothetical protein